jgi:HEAT repeat protein
VAARRLSIWSWTLALSATYVALIVLTWYAWVRPRVADAMIAPAIAVAVVQAAMIVVILAGVSLRRAIAARRAARSAVIRHAVDAIVAEAAAGGDPLQQARALHRIRPRETLDLLARAAGSLRGEVRERIEWTIRGLGGTMPEEEDPIDIEALATAPLLDRALAAEASRAGATRLAENAIPRALESSDPRVALAALELLVSWRRLLPVRGAIELIAHHDARVREAACRAAPYVVPPEGLERVTRAIGGALEDFEASVRAAAARAAGSLAIADLAPALDRLIADPDPEVSLAAAFALAALPDGVSMLTRRSTGAARTAAAHAFEALEKRSLGRLEAL